MWIIIEETLKSFLVYGFYKLHKKVNNFMILVTPCLKYMFMYIKKTHFHLRQRKDRTLIFHSSPSTRRKKKKMFTERKMESFWPKKLSHLWN